MAKQMISVVRGTTNFYTINISNSDTGEPYALSTGEVFRFGVKKNEDALVRVIEKELTVGSEEGVYQLDIRPEDTLGLALGKYHYDIGLQSGNDYYPVIEWSEFVVTPNASEKR